MIGFSYGSLPTISSPFVLTFYGKKYYAQNFSVLGLYYVFLIHVRTISIQHCSFKI